MLIVVWGAKKKAVAFPLCQQHSLDQIAAKYSKTRMLTCKQNRTHSLWDKQKWIQSFISYTNLHLHQTNAKACAPRTPVGCVADLIPSLWHVTLSNRQTQISVSPSLQASLPPYRKNKKATSFTECMNQVQDPNGDVILIGTEAPGWHVIGTRDVEMCLEKTWWKTWGFAETKEAQWYVNVPLNFSQYVYGMSVSEVIVTNP